MKQIILTALLGAAIYSAKAQTTDIAITEHNPAIKTKDSLINVQIIKPARQAAAPGDPDWDAIQKTITAKYDGTTADRTITKAKIYFYYNKDWPKFCTGIVHYTDNWELANDYPLLNLNAGMLLQWDTNPTELKEALRWAKAAANSDPNNEKFKTTYDALSAKVSQ